MHTTHGVPSGYAPVGWSDKRHYYYVSVFLTAPCPSRQPYRQTQHAPGPGLSLCRLVSKPPRTEFLPRTLLFPSARRNIYKPRQWTTLQGNKHRSHSGLQHCRHSHVQRWHHFWARHTLPTQWASPDSTFNPVCLIMLKYNKRLLCSE